MELNLTTNTNAIFLYPLSQKRNPGTTSGSYRSPSRTTSTNSTALSPQTSRVDAVSDGNDRSERRERSTSVFSLPSSSSTDSSPNGSISRINLLSDDHLEEFRSQDSAHSSPVLFVTVHLTVPVKSSPPKMIQSLMVTVRSIESLSFPRGRYEQSTTFEKKVIVEQAAGAALSPGSIYRWEIMIPIPHTNASYERIRYGSSRQRVSAKITFSGILSRTLTFEKPFIFITAPTKDSTESFSWSRTHAASTGHLGPFFIALRTQHLTVGGFVRAALVLSAPRPSLKLQSFSVKVIQQVRIRSRQDPKYSESCLPTQVEFLTATAEDLSSGSGSNSHNEPIERAWVVRLPDCQQIRPSTIAGSDSAILVSHNIEVHLSFLDKPFPSEKVNPCELDEQGRRLYHYRVSWYITLPSCTLRWRSLRLPAYSLLDSDPVPTTPRVFSECEKGESTKYCTCGETLESLLSYECEAETDLFTSALIQEDINRFRLISSKHTPIEHAISGGTGFVYENFEGEVLEETDEERKCRLQREKESNEYAAVEDGSGVPGVMLMQGPSVANDGTLFKV